jgi:hypothetical protein
MEPIAEKYVLTRSYKPCQSSIEAESRAANDRTPQSSPLVSAALGATGRGMDRNKPARVSALAGVSCNAVTGRTWEA